MILHHRTVALWTAGCAAVWVCIGPVGCCAPAPNTHDAGTDAAALQVTSEQIAKSEVARVGSLERIHARGVAEMRSKDDKGEHFDQGDIDVRWNPKLGLAASLSKLGDRWAWIGSDTVAWWIFELKSNPTTLRTGPLSAPRAGLAPAFPWLLGIKPLVPADGSKPELIKGTLRVQLATPAGSLPDGAVLEGEFDPQTLIPLMATVTLKDGTVWRSGFKEWMTVETPGVAQGAWPRVPRRGHMASGLDERWTTIVIALETARADPGATDKPSLYDLASLQKSFAPQSVETEP